MATYQRVALFILFDAIEADLISRIRQYAHEASFLTSEERGKAAARISKRTDSSLSVTNDSDLLYGLDLGDKYSVLMRLKDDMTDAVRTYYTSLTSSIERLISVRNDVMHGRPMTMDQQVIALSFAQQLMRHSEYWPSLRRSYLEYTDNPTAFLGRSIDFLDEPIASSVINNLPVPDYDDTGFLPRSDLERDLKKKILGRNPVISVLGDGGNGKTALTLQVLHNLVQSNDHDFNAIIWVTAKSTELTVAGIKDIEDSTVEAIHLMDAAAMLEAGEGSPSSRLVRLLSQNKVLLVVDNYETVIGNEFAKLAEDVPGQSKLLFTSRHPVGGDLTVIVGELSPTEALTYFYRLINVYETNILKRKTKNQVETYLQRLSYKPLLIKWLVRGVKAGLDPDSISLSPDTALRFCLENVLHHVGPEAQSVLYVLATLPSPAAAGVIQLVSGLKPIQVTDGLAELSRYGLIDLKVTPDGGQVFAIKPFSRTYITRLVHKRKELSDKILAKYKQIEGEYQQQKALTASNRYSQRNFVVRTRAEMVIARKLRQATDYALNDEEELAEILLNEAKVLEPTYFESHRVESFIAQYQNDWTRAIAASEAAISLAPEEPQLHFYFASLLMRLVENEKAAKAFEKALALDRSNVVLREAARNEYILCRFESAQALIAEAFGEGDLPAEDYTKLVDIQLQLFVREIEFLVRSDEVRAALSVIEKLSDYLVELPPSVFDVRMRDHVLKVLSPLFQVRRFLPEEKGPVSLIRLLEKMFIDVDAISGVADPRTGEHQGVMKIDGRKIDYAFLASDTAPDAFVHITNVTFYLWEWMVAGGEVRYDVTENSPGRFAAYNVSKAI